jgi:hypothetical protein
MTMGGYPGRVCPQKHVSCPRANISLRCGVCGHFRLGNTLIIARLTVSTFHVMVDRRHLCHRSTMKNGRRTITTGPFCSYSSSVSLLFSLAIVLVTERLCAHKRTDVRPPFFSALGRKPLPYSQLLLSLLPFPHPSHWHGRCSRLRHSGIRWRIPTSSYSPSCITSDSHERDSGQRCASHRASISQTQDPRR